MNQDLEKVVKKQGMAIKVLGAVSLVLAVCLVLSLMPKKAVTVPDEVPTVTDSSSNQGLETVGIASKESLGDYTAAKSYEQVSDYIKKVTANEFGYQPIDLYAEASKEEATVDTAVQNEAAAGSATTGAVSSTNIMTYGVDESDISKTDGEYIYNATGSEIIIFDIRKGEAVEINRLVPQFSAPSDMIREIYLDGDILSVIIEHEIFYQERATARTEVFIYNISDRMNPEYLDKYWQDGTYNTSRKVGDIIYLFTDKYIAAPGNSKNDAVPIDDAMALVPLVNEKAISYDCIYLPESGRNSVIISSFNQKDAHKTIDTKMIINDYAQTYVGEDSIYLYSQSYTSNREILKISKLPYKDGMINAGESTSLRGHLNDAFAINEYKGNLRVVTTEWADSISNMLYVFDSELKEQGRISNIAPGEQLYACRFMGDTGYFVTYEQTDPLFTLDLTNPKKPEIIGELELPGFSEYLHFWGDGKLLGIGYESTNDGERTGIKLSMFDITNPAMVSEISKYVLKGEGYSPGFYNYKAIMASPEANIIGFTSVSYGNRGENVKYKVFSFDDGRFTQKLSENMDRNSAERIRGHFAGDYIYVSRDTEVKSFEK